VAFGDGGGVDGGGTELKVFDGDGDGGTFTQFVEFVHSSRILSEQHGGKYATFPSIVVV